MPVVLMNLIIVERILGCILCKTICCLVTRYAHVGFYFFHLYCELFLIEKVVDLIPDSPDGRLRVSVVGGEGL